MDNIKIKLYTALFFTSMLFLLSCENRKSISEIFDKDLYNPHFSSNFKISTDKDSVNSLITVYNPWQGSEDVSSEFLVARDGNIPPGFKGEIVKGKVERIICMSSTHIAMLEALGKDSLIVGVSGLQYVSNRYVNQNKDTIPDIGYEGNIDYERLLAVNPDLVLLFSVNGASGMEPKLKEFGIPYIYIGDYVEEDPLGKVEWIMPVAEILGIRDKGLEIFEDVRRNYTRLVEKVQCSETEAPKVMVNAPFANSWFMPSTDSYVARMIKDAGAEYVYGFNTGNSSEPIDLESALKLVSSSHFWINIGDVRNKKQLLAQFPKFSDTPCVVNGNIYNNNLKTTPGGGNDCYESGAVRQDLVLRDLIKIFHPELIEEDFTYYLRLE